MSRLLGVAVAVIVVGVLLAGILWLLWWLFVIAAVVAVVGVVWRAVTAK